MTALVQLIRTREVPEVLAAGPRHPEFGRLVDIGTSVVVEPIGGDVVGGLGASHRDDEFELAVADCIEVGLGSRLERRAQADPVLVLLVPPGDTPEPWAGLLIVVGPELPVMGVLGTREPEVIDLTVRTVLGSPQLGSIFTEPEEPYTQASEQHLVARMRQLYGE